MSGPSLATRVGTFVGILSGAYRIYEQADAGSPLMPSNIPEKGTQLINAMADRIDELEIANAVQKAALELEPSKAKAAAGELGGPPRFIVVSLVDRIQRLEDELISLRG